MTTPKEFMRDGKVAHYSVGAVVQKDGKYLLIDRAIPPLGFAGIAGHVDAAESVQGALVREVEEESGFKVTLHKLLFEEFLAWNWCSKGVEGHRWYLFECGVEGEVKQNYRETKSVGWYSKEQIQKLTLEPVWEYWFKKLAILL